MISKTIYSKGQDNFDIIFNDGKWSAPLMVSPDEIREYIDSFSLCGRRINEIKIVGFSYIHNRDEIEDRAYDQLEHLPEDERRRLSFYKNINREMKFPRGVQTDEPFMILFDDGDRFEIDAPQDPEFRMSMNCIPWFIESGIQGEGNLDADVMFSNCKGQVIKGVEVNTYRTDKDPFGGDKFDEPPFERELVSDIVLRFESGLGLKFSSWYDYFCVECVDANNEATTIKFSELEKALYNYEDIHQDETIGFDPESCSLYFGDKGTYKCAEPFITMYNEKDEDSDIKVHINLKDFLLLNWSIVHITGSVFFDFYADDYYFTLEKWQSILAEAERILSFKTFDELFDDFAGWNVIKANNYMICELNKSGAEYWKDRKKYREILEDIKKWSKMVLKDGDILNIYGF